MPRVRCLVSGRAGSAAPGPLWCRAVGWRAGDGGGAGRAVGHQRGEVQSLEPS